MEPENSYPYTSSQAVDLVLSQMSILRLSIQCYYYLSIYSKVFRVVSFLEFR